MDDHPDHIAHWTPNGYIDGGVYTPPSPVAHHWYYSHAYWEGYGIGIVLCLALIVLAIYVVKRFVVIKGQEVAIVERLGVPLDKVLRPGLHWIKPLHKIRYTLNLQQYQHERTSEVKTSDDAFISITWVVRHAIQNDDASILAYAYKVEKPVSQMIWRVENELRQLISTMTMNDLYSQKDQLAHKIIADQTLKALETGLVINDVVLEQPRPPKAVEAAMNNKLTARAQQEAATAEAESIRIKRIGEASADKESKRLQGEGIADQRTAITQGFKASFDMLKESIPEAQASDLLALINQMVQSDMVVSAARKGASTVFVPYGQPVTVNQPVGLNAE